MDRRITIGEVFDIEHKTDGSVFMKIRAYTSRKLEDGTVKSSFREEFFNANTEYGKYFSDVKAGDWVKIISYPFRSPNTKRTFWNVIGRVKNFDRDSASDRGKVDFFQEMK